MVAIGAMGIGSYSTINARTCDRDLVRVIAHLNPITLLYLLADISLPTTTMPDSQPIVSANAIIGVHNYNPQEGEPGVPVTVQVGLQREVLVDSFRVIFGDTAVGTKVTPLDGLYHLDIIAPPFDNTHISLHVQALDDDENVIDTVTFGEFHYWLPGTYLVLELSFLLTYYQQTHRRRDYLLDRPSTPLWTVLPRGGNRMTLLALKVVPQSRALCARTSRRLEDIRLSVRSTLVARTPLMIWSPRPPSSTLLPRSTQCAKTGRPLSTQAVVAL